MTHTHTEKKKGAGRNRQRKEETKLCPTELLLDHLDELILHSIHKLRIRLCHLQSLGTVQGWLTRPRKSPAEMNTSTHTHTHTHTHT